MRILNIGFINLARTRGQLFARPEWLGFEHPVDHVPPPEAGTIIPLRPRTRPTGVTKRVAGSD